MTNVTLTQADRSSNPKAFGSWVVAVAGVIPGVAVSLAVVPAFWATNDDYYIQLILSGAISGSPSAYVTFVNWGLCWVVSQFFTVVPDYPWWAMLQFTALCLAFSFIARTAVVLIRARWRPLPAPCEILLASLMAFCLSACFVARMQFTTTSTLLMVAAMFGSCCWRPEEDSIRGGLFSRWLLPTFLAVLGFSYRRQSGYIGYFFWVLLLMAIVLPYWKEARRSGWSVVRSAKKCLRERLDCVLPIATAGILCLCLLGIHSVAYSSQEWQDALHFSKALSQYTDYPHQSYEQDPVRYETQGWDEDLAWLVSNWYLMDERVNTDALEDINDGNSLSIENIISDPLGTIRARMGDIVQLTPAAYTVLGVAVGVLVLSHARSRWHRGGVWLVSLAGVALVIYLLVFKGRLPERAYYSILLPAISSLLTLGCAIMRLQDCQDGYSRARTDVIAYAMLSVVILSPFVIGEGTLIFIACLGAAALMVFMVVTGRPCVGKPGPGSIVVVLSISLLLMPGLAAARQYGRSSENYQYEQEHEVRVATIAAYLDAHPESFYIVNPSGGLVSFRPWNMEIKRNADSWGGWRFCYPWYESGMKKSALGHIPTNSDLFRTNVHYISSSSEMDQRILGCLRNQFGDVRMERVDRISDDIFVYQFVLEN